MRIAVVGAGGVGGLVAGLLSRAGHDVAVVARGRTLAAIQERGLRIESSLGTISARVEAAASPAELAPADAVLLAVKTWQVPEVAASLDPLLGSRGIVVPLQNGVDAPEQCAEALGEARVVGGLCRMLSWSTAPGDITHAGPPPAFTLGAHRAPLDDRAEALRSALEGAGSSARIVDDFPVALWEKFMFIASFGGVSALSRSNAGVLRAIPETRRLLEDACAEVHAVGRARGVALGADAVPKTVAYVDALPDAATPSLQRDVLAGRPSEIDALSGAVARMGRAARVPVPVHTAIHAALLPQERAARGGG